MDVDACPAVTAVSLVTVAFETANGVRASGFSVAVMSVVLAFVIIGAGLAVAAVAVVAGAGVATMGVGASSIGVTTVSLVLTLVHIFTYDTVTCVALPTRAVVACTRADALTHTLGDAATPDSSVAFVIFWARTRETTVGVCTQSSFA